MGGKGCCGCNNNNTISRKASSYSHTTGEQSSPSEDHIIDLFMNDKLEIVQPVYNNENVMKKIETLKRFDWSKDYGSNDDDVEQLNLCLRGLRQMGTAFYEGQWDAMRDTTCGRGIKIWADGSRYDGFWKNGLRNGYGRLIHIDGEVYEGMWLDDQAHGHAIYTLANGNRYEGNWENDKQNGFGVEKWIDGSVYEGLYRNGLKTGIGKFTWPDQSFYMGEFFENDLQGKGEYRWADGRVFNGQWHKSRMDGYGVFEWVDGRKYEGEYKNDLKQGQGTFTWSDGSCYKGFWFNGKQHGEGIYLKGGKSRRGIWENGKCVQYHRKDGSITLRSTITVDTQSTITGKEMNTN